MTIAVHLGLSLVTVAAILYGAVRAAGLTDLGRKVDLVERSILRGEEDRGLCRSAPTGRLGRVGLTAAMQQTLSAECP